MVYSIDDISNRLCLIRKSIFDVLSNEKSEDLIDSIYDLALEIDLLEDFILENKFEQ